MTEYRPGWDEETLRADIKFPRGEPIPIEHPDEMVPWQKGHVFMPRPYTKLVNAEPPPEWRGGTFHLPTIRGDDDQS